MLVARLWRKFAVRRQVRRVGKLSEDLWANVVRCFVHPHHVQFRVDA